MVVDKRGWKGFKIMRGKAKAKHSPYVLSFLIIAVVCATGSRNGTAGKKPLLQQDLTALGGKNGKIVKQKQIMIQKYGDKV